MTSQPDTEGATGEALATVLLTATPSQAQWDQIFARTDRDNERLADDVKSELDRLVRRDPRAAIELATRLELLTRRLPSRRALGLRGRAVAFHASGRSQEAVDDYRAALTQYEAEQEHLEAAKVRRSLVDVLQMNGESDAALEEAELARATLESMGEERLLAQLECNVGNVYFRLDRYVEASESYRRAVARFERLDDDLGRAFALYNLGNVETNANRFDEAEASFRASERVFTEQDHSILAADSRYGLAYLAFRRGDYADAEQLLRASRDEFDDLGKTSGPPLCDMDLAELHLRLDSWRDARDRAEAAAARFAVLGMAYEEARSTLFAGVAHARLGATEEAERALAQSARLFERLGNRVLGALVVIHRAELRRTSDRLAELLPTLTKARADLAASGDRFLADLGELALARAQLALGRHDQARSSLQTLLERRDGRLALQTLIEIDAWTALAEVHRLCGESDEEEVALEHAIEAGEDAFARLSFGDARLAFFRERQPAVTRLVAARLMRLGSAYAREGVERLDGSRQRSLDETEARRFPDNAPMRAARARLDALLNRQLDATTGASAEPSRGPAADVSDELFEAQEHVMSLARQQRAPAPSGPASGDEVGTGTGSLAAVPTGDALLYYLMDGDDLFVVFGDPSEEGELTTTKLSCSTNDLARIASGLRFQVGKLRLGTEYVTRHAEGLERNAKSLFDRMGELLLAPAARILDGRPVTIVPMGVLHELPIHAATIAGRALIESCDVSYARSLRQLGRSRSPRSIGGDWLACFSPEHDLPAIALEHDALTVSLGDRLRAREAGHRD